MKNTLISVILPVYNCENFISDSIDSILKQTYKNFELIIINDGSTDNTDNIIKSFQDIRIKYIKRENRGLVKTLNQAIDLSKGDFIARQDADDISKENRLERLLNIFNRNNKLIITGSLAKIIDKNNNNKGILYRPYTNGQIKAYIPFETPFIHGSVMFRRKVKKLKIKYNNFKHAEDYEFWYQILKYGEGYNTKELLYKYRINSQSISIQNKEIQDRQSEIIREKIQNEIIGKKLYNNISYKYFINIDLSEWEKKRYTKTGLSFVKLLIKNKKYNKAEEELKFVFNIGVFRRLKYLNNKFKIKILKILKKLK